MSGDRIHKALAKEMALRPNEQRIRIIVRYKEHVAKAKAVAAARLPQPPSRVFNIVPAVAVSARTSEIQSLSLQPEVDRIWPDLRVHACLNVSVPLIRAPNAWQDDYVGTGVRIAILDTGIDPEHPDFAGRIASVADFTREGIADANGHGTHVAGIAAGDGTASGGQYVGVAPGSQLYIAKVLDNQGAAFMSDVMVGIDWAVQQQVQVINLSLSGPPPSDGNDPLSEACDLAVEHGFVVCVAAGNSGPGASTIGPPGCARQVITVGASTDDDTLLEASSRGPTADGRVKPDVVFPGAGIISCRAADTCLGNALNSEYAEASGTSMAVAHASGTAALLLEADPELTPSEIKHLIMEGAAELGLEENSAGAGRGDAYAAIIATRALQGDPVRLGCLAQLLALLSDIR